MNKLAVIGPGLLGGSIALAARRLPGQHIAVWARRPEAVEELRTRGIGDFASGDLAEVAREADLVILCVPIGAMPGLARSLAGIVKPGAVITDVGSVKAPVVAELPPLFPSHAAFVGSHPMAGSEQTGLQAARADLFAGSVCIVTPHPEVSLEAVRKVSGFWEALGCHVRELSPSRHDELVALISHTPHLLAAALVNAVADCADAALDLAGPGFRDTTRVAGGPPEMWTEILATNRAAVRNSAEAVIEKLREFITLLDHSEPEDLRRMTHFLSQAKAARERLRLPS